MKKVSIATSTDRTGGLHIKYFNFASNSCAEIANHENSTVYREQCCISLHDLKNVNVCSFGALAWQ